MKKFLIGLTNYFAIIFLFISLNSLGFASVPVANTLSPMLQKVLPAVVNLRSQTRVTDFNTLRELQKQRSGKPNDNNSGNGNGNGNDEDQTPATFVSVGSGVIVDSNNGYILTNSHVVADAQTITVTLGDGRHYTAKVIGLDKPSDIALLQIKAKNLTSIVISDSNKLKVGDFIVAIGSPFGLLTQSVTSGIISGLGRNGLGIENYENFIQTDAPINPGNSGGALINMQGELVGINTAILSPDRGSIGIGFAIPANMAKSVMEQLLEYGDVKRGVLGIGAQDITPELGNAFNLTDAKGAAVTQVLADSPAQQAGLQIGDVIVAVNGSEVKNASDVVNTVGFLRVDSKINIDVLRNNKRITLSVTISDPKKRQQIVAQSNPFLYGVGLKNFTLLSPIHGNIEGVLVVAVEQDSNSWHSDLRPGDIITSVNQQKVKTIDELQTAAKKADKVLLLNVLRGPTAIFLVVNKEES